MAQQQALPVGALSWEEEERLRLGLPAESAEEYLARVRIESLAIPDIIEVTPPPQAVASGRVGRKAHSIVPETEAILPCPEELLPDEDWVRNELAVFAELRQYLAYWSARGVGGKSGMRKPVPALKDELGWRIFCLGLTPEEMKEQNDEEEEEEGTGEPQEERFNEGEGEERDAGTPSAMETSSELDLPEAATSPDLGVEAAAAAATEVVAVAAAQTEEAAAANAAEKAAAEAAGAINVVAGKPVGMQWAQRYPVGCPPTVHLILQFDQVMVLKLLDHHARWLKRQPLTREHAEWIYALLARLDKPLVRDSAAVVHELLRRCCAQKAAGGEGWPEGSCAALDVLIAATGRFFAQAPAPPPVLS